MSLREGATDRQMDMRRASHERCPTGEVYRFHGDDAYDDDEAYRVHDDDDHDDDQIYAV